MQIAPYLDADFDGVRALWTELFPNDPPWNRAEVAIPEKLATQRDLLLVAKEDGGVIGTAMAGYDGHRGRLYTVAVKASQQRKGIASALVEQAEKRLVSLGCSKINLQIRSGNEAVTAFYRRHGYQIEERISMGKRFNAKPNAGLQSL